MKEQLIVTLTTWKARIRNIPTVLDSIFNQTIPPDFVVLNLAYEEEIPEEVQAYIDSHKVEVNRVPDTKVYKKLIPTLNKYPEAVVIPIDDDWIYPPRMIEEFMDLHKKHPFQPISGNKVYEFGTHFHCGCASLTKREYYGKYLDRLDDGILRCCQSDDTFYTWCAYMNACRYIRTECEYYENMVPFNAVEAYSAPDSLTPLDTWFYLCGRFANPQRRKLKLFFYGMRIRLKEWGLALSRCFKKEEK